jgi:hypothetical protein
MAEAVIQQEKAMTDSTRTFFQSHQCSGFHAKVTIEWSFPKDIDADMLPADRISSAEEIADSILELSGPMMRAMVQAMRGYTAPPPMTQEKFEENLKRST